MLTKLIYIGEFHIRRELSHIFHYCAYHMPSPADVFGEKLQYRILYSSGLFVKLE